MSRDRTPELGEQERARLAAGEHEQLARELEHARRLSLAAWVREQIWDFAGAANDYLHAHELVEALRSALEADTPLAIDPVLSAIEQSDDERVLDEAIELLRRRARHHEAARLLAIRGGDPFARADALARAGDRVGAARVLADAGRTVEALRLLDPEHDGDVAAGGGAAAHGLAARLCWDLGDAEGAARHAQRACRSGATDPATLGLLARALAALGHDLAAQIALDGHEIEGPQVLLPGRYRVTAARTAHLAGAAYVGFDRVTLEEVEIHLLLAEQEGSAADPAIVDALEKFAASARGAAAIGHPAIRPILRLEPESGLLVMPRADGPDLRALVRPPGLRTALPRVRALVAFLAEGLQLAHQRGLVHGGLLPSAIVTDALGRPVLGPFGAHHLAGLAATRTAVLEEILATTAPELRQGAPPSVAADLYAVGALLAALISGELRPLPDDDGSAEATLARALLDPDPEARPGLDIVLARLRAPIADLRELAADAGDDAAPPPATSSARLQTGIAVTPADTWSDAQLDALCREPSPWLQPILDRDGRRIVLAPWPEGSRVLAADADWRAIVPAGALGFVDVEVATAVLARLQPSSWVATPASAWMIALDDLLTR